MTEFIAIGEIIKPFQLSGLAKISSYSKNPKDIFNYDPWYVGKEKTLYNAEISHPKASHVIAKVRGIDSHEKAASISGQTIYIKKTQLPELKQDEYYWHEIIGFNVYSKNNKRLGEIILISDHNDIDMATIRTDKLNEVMIPLIKPYLLALDKEQRQIKIDWPDEDFND